MTFAHVGNGYVNLAQAARATRNRDGGFELEAADGTVLDRNCAGFDHKIVQVVPPSGEWECLSMCFERDGTISTEADPVMLFGLTTTGDVVPITPGDSEGVFLPHGLRKVGDPRVHVAHGGVFANAEAWVAELNKDRAEDAARLKVVK